VSNQTSLPPNTLLAAARRRLSSPTGSGRELSRQEVAEAVNEYLWTTYNERASLSRNYIGKLEQGKHRWPRKRYREALRHVLGVANDTDLGFFVIRGEAAFVSSSAGAETAAHSVPAGEEEFDVNRRELLAGVGAPGLAALVAVIAAPFAGSFPAPRLPPDDDLGRLATRLARIRQAYQHSQYESAADALPSLLGVLRRQRERGASPSRLARLDAEAHQVASALLLKGEQPVPAAMAAERSMTAAREVGDELIMASSVRAVVHCLMASGHPDQAAALATDAASRLGRSVNLDGAAAVSVYGALLLRGAIVAARLEDHDQSQTLLDEAKRAARRLGDDRNLHWTAFGPTNVAAHQVAVAVELGDAGTAVRLASSINLSKLGLPERRAMLLLDTARALTQWGKWERAFEAIRRAERHAPEEVRARPAVHAMIQELASRAPSPLRRHVHDYARAVGAPA
jgi:transcriptional regulator with XRE-family HTH domain